MGYPAAHPRSRGENLLRIPASELVKGSSPLTRGKPAREPPESGAHGLIPAHAGKTRGRPRRTCPARAHPRSRGENGGWDTPIGDWRGSSPLTRGKPRPRARRRVVGGLIPAHAGKTGATGLRWNQHRAHPRSRGENTTKKRSTPIKTGSSPLTRGKLHAVGGELRRDGLIPAHAGKTMTPESDARPNRAHPRSRGENACTELRLSLCAGSSPLTRGKRDHLTDRNPDEGLIPAHAGKTETRAPNQLGSAAHPRSRGEN